MIADNKCVDREKLFGFVHHLLEPGEEAEVRHHLDQCSECQHVAQGFAKLDAVLEEWRKVNPSPWFDQRLKQALASGGPASAFRFFFSLSSTRVFAALLAVLFVVVGSIMIHQFSRSGPSGQANAPAAQVQPPPTTQAQPQPQTAAQAQTLPAEEELKMYQNLAVLENFDLLENFDVLSELPKGNKVAN